MKMAKLSRLVMVLPIIWLADSGTTAYARELAPRLTVDKTRRAYLPDSVPVTNIIVKFQEGSRVRLRDGHLRVVDRDARDRSSLRALNLTDARVQDNLGEVERLVAGVGQLHRLLSTDENQLAERRRRAEQLTGLAHADLDLYYRLVVPEGTNAGDVEGLLRALNALPSVEIAYAEAPAASTGVAMAGRLTSTADDTPDLSEWQTYLDPAPLGIDARYAWTQNGGKGAGINIVDVERTWHLTHEDLPSLALGVDGPIDPGTDNHGTAVLGMLGGKDNLRGVKGIVTDAAFGAVSTYPTNRTVADAVQLAATKAGVRGVVLVEIQILGARRPDPTTCTWCGNFHGVCDYVAVEWEEATWDVIRAAVSNGTVVVEAAGNGGANLDAAHYKKANIDWFSRSHDSGAIFVGAAEALPDAAGVRAPTCFTNYGKRVDLHGWGWDVVTLGYGAWWHPADDPDNADRWYTNKFSGTSSASPMVVGSVASVQGAVLARGQNALTPAVIRDFLRRTGTDQDPATKLTKNIGAMPNLRAAHLNISNNVPPVAEFTATCSQAPRACTFDGTASTDNVAITAYAWSFGDGATGSGATTSHTYGSYGPYVVTLTVTDTAGATGSKSTTVAFDAPPTANFTVSCAAATCTANASSSTDDHGIASYSWNWGDGQLSSGGPTTTHVYAASGTYGIVLTVTDTIGQTGTSAPKSVTVNAPPKPSIAFNCLGLQCTFDGSATTEPDGQPVTYRWLLGSTTIGTSVTLNYTFAVTGTYDVTLQATDSAGAAATSVRRVSVTSESSVALWHWNNGKPCRVYDSRFAGTGAKIAGGTTLSVPLVSGSPCPIPEGTQAVLLNVTALQPTGNGNLKVWGIGTEPNTAALNFTPSWDPRAGNVTVRVLNTASRSVSLKASVFPPAGTPAETHLIVDVVGFYGDSSAPSASCGQGNWCGPMGFKPVAQCRMLDTRSSGGQIDPGTTRYVKISGSCGIPSSLQSALALSMNVTALPLGNGNLVAFDSAHAPDSLASVSILNYRMGRNQPNGTVLRVSSRTDDVDDLAVQARVSATNVILDVTGYFASTSLMSDGMAFYPVAPCRALDTRFAEYGHPGRVVTGVPSAVQIAGNCGIPRGAKAVVVYSTAFNPSTSGNLKVFPAGAPTPGTSVLNFLAGDAIGNSTIIELGTATKDLTLLGTLNGDSTASLDVILDVYGYFAPAP